MFKLNCMPKNKSNFILFYVEIHSKIKSRGLKKWLKRETKTAIHKTDCREDVSRPFPCGRVSFPSPAGDPAVCWLIS